MQFYFYKFRKIFRALKIWRDLAKSFEIFGQGFWATRVQALVKKVFNAVHFSAMRSKPEWAARQGAL